jgi:hypothetical protein
MGIIAAVVFLVASQSYCATVFKNNNTVNLNQGSS